MSIIRVSATAARNRFFDLLNQVMLGTQVIIERDSKEVAVLSKKQTFDWVAFRKAAKKSQGILKDYTIDELLPLRKKGAWKNWGKWDR